jgi:hypothetical protein
LINLKLASLINDKTFERQDMNLFQTATMTLVLGATVMTTTTAIAFEFDGKADKVAALTQAATNYFIEQLSRRTGSAVATFGDGTFVLSGNGSARPVRLSVTLPEGAGRIPAESCLKMETFAVGEYKASVPSSLGVRCVLGGSWSVMVPVLIETK